MEKLLSGGRFTDLERDAFFGVVRFESFVGEFFFFPLFFFLFVAVFRFLMTAFSFRDTSALVFASTAEFGKRLKVGNALCCFVSLSFS